MGFLCSKQSLLPSFLSFLEILSQVYTGSPSRVSHEKAFTTARDSRMPLYKARRVSLNGRVELDQSEMFITYKKYETNAECAIALAKLGCSEEVLIVEGLHLLEDEFNHWLESEAGIPQYKQDCEMIFLLASKGSLHNLLLYEGAMAKKAQGKILTKKEQDVVGLNIGGRGGGICKFVNGLMIAGGGCESTNQDTSQGSLIKLHRKAQKAVKNSGADVFKHVLDNVVREHSHMKPIFAQTRCVLVAWNEVYRRRISRNVKSHPFLMINSDVDMARKALAAFLFLMAEYPVLEPLMRASIPLITADIQAKESTLAQRKIHEERSIEGTLQLLGI